MGRDSGPPEFKVPSSSGRSFLRFFAHMPRSCEDPGGTFDTRHGVSSGAGFSILLLDPLPRLYYYGAISTFRRMRTALWPACFPVYASPMLFRQTTLRSPFPRTCRQWSWSRGNLPRLFGLKSVHSFCSSIGSPAVCTAITSTWWTPMAPADRRRAGRRRRHRDRDQPGGLPVGRAAVLGGARVAC